MKVDHVITVEEPCTNFVPLQVVEFGCGVLNLVDSGRGRDSTAQSTGPKYVSNL